MYTILKTQAQGYVLGEGGHYKFKLYIISEP
jgi:hypothetical protein